MTKDAAPKFEWTPELAALPAGYEALDSWEIELALKVKCPRCGAEPDSRCVVPSPDYGVVGEPSHIHPMRLSFYQIQQLGGRQ